MAPRRSKQDEHRENSDEISKKDLLRQVGISYGQFYRWKRMGLIPEAWFRRRSTFTGQETFLPRRKVLQRIERIMSMRNQASLDEIAQTLSPDLTDRRYGPAELDAMGWISPRARQLLPVEADGQLLSFLEVVCLSMTQRFLESGALVRDQIVLAARTLLAGFGELDAASERRLTVIASGNSTSVLLHERECVFDRQTKVVTSVNLNELIEQIKVALRDLIE